MSTYSCDNCSRYVIGETDAHRSSFHGIDPGEWIESVGQHLKWTPARGRRVTFEDVPEHISSAASEAVACMSIGAFRGAVQLARSVVEASAKERRYATGTLAGKVQKMFADGLLRPHIREAADEIRFLGNEMAHGDFVVPVTEEEAVEVLGLMGEVLQELFQSPQRVERRRQARLAKEAEQRRS